jgi:hypothetical protein
MHFRNWRFQDTRHAKRNIWPLNSNVKEITLHFKAQWLIHVPPSITLKNRTFCPQSFVMCFVWISEQTAILSFYGLNLLDIITKTECLYCAVRTVFNSGYSLSLSGLSITSTTTCQNLLHQHFLSLFLNFIFLLYKSKSRLNSLQTLQDFRRTDYVTPFSLTLFAF